MTAPAPTADPLPPPESETTRMRPRRVSVREVAFVVLALAAVALAQLGMPTSPVAAAAVVLIVSALAMHVRLAKGLWPAAAYIVASASLLAALGAPPRVLVVVAGSALAAAVVVAQCSRRADALQAGALIGLLAGLLSLLEFLASTPPPAGMIMREALGAAIGGLLSGPAVLTFGPLAEWVFGHTTRLTMAEWLNFEHPLLKQLAEAAPGTFQHSVNVGVLAAAAARAIKADALVARVGGLYHDVGKMRAPEYFVENQGGSNPHDLLHPRDSADILRAHVSDGVDLVLEHGMGGRIADFVREHHGTGVMRLLQERAEALGEADESDDTYRYPGPRPRSRETGLVMIADQLEATARAEPPADEATSRAIVQRTIDRIRAHEQLDDSHLSAGDVDAIVPPLARAVKAMYHRRLTYPAPGTGPKKRSKFAVLVRALPRRARS